MLTLSIKEKETITIKHLVLDFNGTLAIDGILIKGVREILHKLSSKLKIHIITADTFGSVRKELPEFKIKIISAQKQAEQKRDYVNILGKENCIAIGNGFNDHLMLKESKLGIVVIQSEAAHKSAILAADIICKNIFDALQLFQFPDRLKAVMRN